MPREPHLRGRGPFLPPLDQVVQYPEEPGYVVFTLPAPKRVRVMAGGHTLADTSRALLLFESDHIPIYYIPVEDVAMDLFVKGMRTHHSPWKGDATHYSLKGQEEAYEGIMWRYETPRPECPDIAGYVSFYWHEVDQWFEEDTEVFVHVRDPFRRVDTLPSSREVVVELDGREVARSTRGVFLFETGLPTRYYIPKEDVADGLLQPSDQTTHCPYKGEAHYFHAVTDSTRHENLVWFYPDPVHESDRIRGLVCFTAERVDRTLVDGVEIEKPQTAFVRGYNYHGYKD